jgi:glycogen synthase
VRICLICKQIAAWGKIGGLGTNSRQLGRALVAQGTDVHVVVPRRPGQGRIETLDGLTMAGQAITEVFFGKKLYQEINADIYHAEEPTRTVKILQHTISLIFTASPFLSPQLDFQLDMAHAETH